MTNYEVKWKQIKERPSRSMRRNNTKKNISEIWGKLWNCFCRLNGIRSARVSYLPLRPAFWLIRFAGVHCLPGYSPRRVCLTVKTSSGWSKKSFRKFFEESLRESLREANRRNTARMYPLDTIQIPAKAPKCVLIFMMTYYITIKASPATSRPNRSPNRRHLWARRPLITGAA